jgi:DNA-binding beta-propeller fold protein YncE
MRKSFWQVLAFAMAWVLFSSSLWATTAPNFKSLKTITGTAQDYGLQDTNPYAAGYGPAAKFNNPSGIAFNNVGFPPTFMYVADTDNHVIRRVTLATGAVTTIAGSGIAGWADGVKTAARFNRPTVIAIDRNNEYLYVTDENNGAIRKISIALGDHLVTTLIGKNCTPLQGTFGSGGDTEAAGGCLNTNYVPGSGTAASFWRPTALIMS